VWRSAVAVAAVGGVWRGIATLAERKVRVDVRRSCRESILAGQLTVLLKLRGELRGEGGREHESQRKGDVIEYVEGRIERR
jgi:hypothetical protein